MSDVAVRQSTDVATSGSDPYAAKARKVSQSGLYLAFSKGEYIYGQNKEELRLGKRLVANMPGLRDGWRCWSGGKVVEDRTELVSDGKPDIPRNGLGDLDKTMWDRDDRGDPRDPWVETFILDLADPATMEAYTLSISSKGGRRKMGDLLEAYSKEYRMRPGMLPIIELQRESYLHNNKEYGKIYNPVLPIVGWTDADNPSVDDVDANLGPGQRAANPTQEAAGEQSHQPAASPISSKTTFRSESKPTRF